MLRADVVMKQPVGLFSRKLQDPLGFGAERDLHRCGDLFPEHGPAFNFLADVFEGEMRSRENSAGESLAFTNQAQQEVLGFNRDAAELAGLVTGEEENSPGPFGVPFEHPAYLGKCRWCWGHGNDDHSIRHRWLNR